MASPKYSSSLRKRELATSARSHSSSKIAYRYEEEDITILSGDYIGRLLLDIWVNGDQNDRDFIFKEFWNSDPTARELIQKHCFK